MTETTPHTSSRADAPPPHHAHVTRKSLDRHPDLARATRESQTRLATADKISNAMRQVAELVESDRVLGGRTFGESSMLKRLDLAADAFERVAARERELVGLLGDLSDDLLTTREVGQEEIADGALDTFAWIDPTRLGSVRELRRRVMFGVHKACDPMVYEAWLAYRERRLAGEYDVADEAPVDGHVDGPDVPQAYEVVG